MKIEFKLDLDIANSAGTGGRMAKGAYKIKITNAIVTKSENGNNLLGLVIQNEDGETGYINNICMDKKWASGKESFGYAGFMELMACAGASSITIVKVANDQDATAPKNSEVKELINAKITMVVFDEVDIHKGKETRKLQMGACFLKSGLSLTEKAQGEKEAKRLAKMASRVADKFSAQWLALNGGGDSAVLEDLDEDDYELDDEEELEDDVEEIEDEDEDEEYIDADEDDIPFVDEPEKPKKNKKSKKNKKNK